MKSTNNKTKMNFGLAATTFKEPFGNKKKKRFQPQATNQNTKLSKKYMVIKRCKNKMQH